MTALRASPTPPRRAGGPCLSVRCGHVPARSTRTAARPPRPSTGSRLPLPLGAPLTLSAISSRGSFQAAGPQRARARPVGAPRSRAAGSPRTDNSPRGARPTHAAPPRRHRPTAAEHSGSGAPLPERDAGEAGEAGRAGRGLSRRPRLIRRPRTGPALRPPWPDPLPPSPWRDPGSFIPRGACQTPALSRRRPPPRPACRAPSERPRPPSRSAGKRGARRGERPWRRDPARARPAPVAASPGRPLGPSPAAASARPHLASPPPGAPPPVASAHSRGGAAVPQAVCGTIGAAPFPGGGRSVPRAPPRPRRSPSALILGRPLRGGSKPRGPGECGALAAGSRVGVRSLASPGSGARGGGGCRCLSLLGHLLGFGDGKCLPLEPLKERERPMSLAAPYTMGASGSPPTTLPSFLGTWWGEGPAGSGRAGRRLMATSRTEGVLRVTPRSLGQRGKQARWSGGRSSRARRGACNRACLSCRHHWQ